MTRSDILVSWRRSQSWMYQTTYTYNCICCLVHSALRPSKKVVLCVHDVLNWIANFLSGHSHCTLYQGRTLDLLDITASIIQGSAIGPASFVVHAGDLWAASAGSFLIKYADDRPTYVIIPACNVESRQPELDHICEWSKRNNLMLNRSKSAEIVFSDNRKKRHQILPPPSGGSRRGLGWA